MPHGRDEMITRKLSLLSVNRRIAQIRTKFYLEGLCWKWKLNKLAFTGPPRDQMKSKQRDVSLPECCRLAGHHRCLSYLMNNQTKSTEININLEHKSKRSNNWKKVSCSSIYDKKVWEFVEDLFLQYFPRAAYIFRIELWLIEKWTKNYSR